LETLVGSVTNLPELDGVRVFVAIVEHGGFLAASRALGIPRSTVSHRLAALEGALGVRLLARTTRTVAMTEAGRDYHGQVRAALQMVDDANRRMAGLVAAPRGMVRVALVPGFAATWLGAIAERLLTRYPEVQLVASLEDRMVDLVSEGFDVAVRAGDLPDSGLTARRIGETRFACFASPAYLASHPPLTTPRDLVHHDAVLFIGGLTATWAFEGPERVSVPVRGRYVVNHQGLQLEAGEAGLGVVRLLPFTVRASLEAGRLVRVLPEWHSPPARLYVVTQGIVHRTAALAAFLEVLDEVVGRQPFGDGCLTPRSVAIGEIAPPRA
jgi:DNA-binding transcriptional LysR family regulator